MLMLYTRLFKLQREHSLNLFFLTLFLPNRHIHCKITLRHLSCFQLPALVIEVPNTTQHGGVMAYSAGDQKCVNILPNTVLINCSVCVCPLRIVSQVTRTVLLTISHTHASVHQHWKLIQYSTVQVLTDAAQFDSLRAEPELK